MRILHRVPVVGIAAAIAAAIALSGCSVAPTADAGPPPGDGPVVAFYGDSYTKGTGASSTERRWSTIVSAERGWREFNPSVDGLGFVNNRDGVEARTGDLVPRIVGQDPAIVFVTMGLNDNFSFDRAADEIRMRIDDDLGRLRSGLPDARIVVVEPFWYTDERPASVDTIIGWVEEGATMIDADFITGASRWIEGHPEWMAADGLHPNDDGYAVMADRMDEALGELGL